MEIRNNSSINFQAKLILKDDFINNSNLQKLAKEFEAKTQNKYPNFEIELKRPSFIDKDLATITICDKSDKNNSRLEYVLSKRGTNRFLKLANENIIKKLTKFLNILKKRDIYLKSVSEDIKNLEEKYGIDIGPDIFYKIYKLTLDRINTISSKKIIKDPILSDFIESNNVLK